MQKITFFILSITVFIHMAFVNSNQTSEEKIATGKYSISLNVNDIIKSKIFYEQLGFETLPEMGSVEQKWLILSNGETKIGLFQGLFPSNTITFNPSDVRKIHKKLKEQGITPVFATGMDKLEGPCTFSISDPDGNPILFDQH